jgi:hypothetical protein
VVLLIVALADATPSLACRGPYPEFDEDLKDS